MKKGPLYNTLKEKYLGSKYISLPTENNIRRRIRRRRFISIWSIKLEVVKNGRIKMLVSARHYRV
jgi:hypothetical protein